jgi:hypothetical protein
MRAGAAFNGVPERGIFDVTVGLSRLSGDRVFVETNCSFVVTASALGRAFARAIWW